MVYLQRHLAHQTNYWLILANSGSDLTWETDPDTRVISELTVQLQILLHCHALPTKHDGVMASLTQRTFCGKYHNNLLPEFLFHVLNMAGQNWNTVASILSPTLPFLSNLPSTFLPSALVSDDARVTFRGLLLGCPPPNWATRWTSQCLFTIHHQWKPQSTLYLMNVISSLRGFLTLLGEC